MRCPYCQSEDTQVKDSRPAEDGAAIRRRRVCPDCGGRFTTFERVQLRDLVVILLDDERRRQRYQDQYDDRGDDDEPRHTFWRGFQRFLAH